MIRMFMGAAAVAGGLLAATAGGSVAASAATTTTQTTCSFSGTVHYDAGLVPTAKAEKDTISGSLTGCSDTTQPSGTVSGTLTATAQSCTAGAASGTLTVKWSTGRTTLAHVQYVPGRHQPNVKYFGTVFGGLFKGDAVSSSMQQVDLKGACTATSPLTVGAISGDANY